MSHQGAPAAVDTPSDDQPPSRRWAPTVFLIAVVALSLLTVPLAGGRLSRVSDLRLRWTPVIFAALAIQVLIVSVAPGGDHWLHALLHLVSYGLAGAFLWANR